MECSACACSWVFKHQALWRLLRAHARQHKSLRSRILDQVPLPRPIGHFLPSASSYRFHTARVKNLQRHVALSQFHAEWSGPRGHVGREFIENTVRDISSPESQLLHSSDCGSPLFQQSYRPDRGYGNARSAGQRLILQPPGSPQPLNPFGAIRDARYETMIRESSSEIPESGRALKRLTVASQPRASLRAPAIRSRLRHLHRLQAPY
jgi:hypothetical protein